MFVRIRNYLKLGGNARRLGPAGRDRLFQHGGEGVVSPVVTFSLHQRLERYASIYRFFGSLAEPKQKHEEIPCTCRTKASLSYYWLAFWPDGWPVRSCTGPGSG